MKKMTKWAILISVFMGCLPFLPFLPLQATDLQESGSLTITLHEGTKTVGGGELTIWKVGTIAESGSDLVFELSEAFAKSDIPLTNLENRSVIQALLNYAKTNSIAGIVRRIPDHGTVKLDPLARGLYLVAQTETPKGYETMKPFLISVPVWDDQSSVWKYEVDAYPKAEVESAAGNKPNPTPNNPSTNMNNTNTGVKYGWMEYAGIWLIAMILLFLYFAGSRKKRIH